MNKMKASDEKTFLITGGTGKTGGRVAKRLQKLGLPVRIGSRSAQLKFDWYDESTWKPALENIYAVYISFYPDIAIPGAPKIIRAFAEAAVSMGVKRLVLLSGRGEPEARECEEMVMKAGIEWVILRSSWFSQNFSEGYMLDPILAGHVALPVGDVGDPFVDLEDVADVAVASLTQAKHNAQIYELTGPRLLNFAQAVKEIAEGTGKAIHFEKISKEAYGEVLRTYQVPEEVIKLLTYLFSEVLDGRNESIQDGVERALNRKPTDFSVFVKRAVSSGVWTTADVKS